MGDHSAIEWTDATWNPVAGCTRVSEGCDNCYAATLVAGRLKNRPQYQGLAVVTPSGRAAFNGKIRLLPERLDQPLRWRAPRRIFVNSMSDLFHESIPDSYVGMVFDVMARAWRHTFQVLTKRPERMAALVPTFAARHTAPDGSGWPLPNVWLGTSCENQETADERIPHLLKVPAAVRFLSLEPLLGPIDLDRLAVPVWATTMARGGIDWVIVGGESGRHARPMDPAWPRALRDQCQAAGVAFLFKQWGGRTAKAGGRELDGRTWDEYPDEWPAPLPLELTPFSKDYLADGGTVDSQTPTDAGAVDRTLQGAAGRSRLAGHAPSGRPVSSDAEAAKASSHQSATPRVTESVTPSPPVTPEGV